MKYLPKTHFKTIFAAILFAFALPFAVFANEHEHGEEAKEEAFNAGDLIIDHIGDSYGWHVAGDVAIPLPVILYTDKGLDIFSSAKFEHGHATAHGKYDYRLIENHIHVVNAAGEVDEAATERVTDLSITKNVASLFISAALMLYIFLSVAGAYKKNPNKAPKGMQSFVEPLIIFIRDEVAKPAIGKHKYAKFLPYLLTAFFFIWISNMLGIIPIFPGGANLTGNIAVTMVLAVFTFVITTINGSKHYWGHIFAMPGVPKPVLLILTPIEILGVFLKPFVLMIRLFANIVAGHIIALSFFSLIFIFGAMSAGVGFCVAVFSVAFMIFMWLLEVLVAFIQAYVFTLLSAIYFGAATEEHHEHKESIV